MPRVRPSSVVVHWNGKDTPKELHALPAGDYIVAKYETRKLSVAEEDGVHAGLRSIAEGRTIPWEQVRANLDEMLKAKQQRRRQRRRK